MNPYPATSRTLALAAELSPVETAARVFGLELEGVSAEDRDFELARQLVRFGCAAASWAAQAPAGPPAVVVRDALDAAGRQFAPGLVPAVPASPADLAVRPWPVPPRPVERTGPVEPRVPSGPRAGPWVRNGSAVVLLEVKPAYR